MRTVIYSRCRSIVEPGGTAVTIRRGTATVRVVEASGRQLCRGHRRPNPGRRDRCRRLTVIDGRISSIDLILDPDKLRSLVPDD